MAVATWEDVAVAIGRSVTSDEQDQVDWWLSSVEIQIKGRLGDLAALDQDVLRYVEVEAVAAKLTNPNGYQSETIDDYTYRYGPETRRITILDEWWNLLDPDVGTAAFSVRPSFEADTARWPTSQGEGTYTVGTDGWPAS